MSEISKEVAITTITALMKEHNIKPRDIPECLDAIIVCGRDAEFLSSCVKSFYDRLSKELGEDDAYEFAEDLMKPEFLELCEIYKPQRYKIATVSLVVDVKVPQEYTNCDIEKYVYMQDFNEENFALNEIQIMDSNISEAEIEHFEGLDFIGD